MAESNSSFSKLINILKKPFGSLDDIWNSSKAFIPRKIVDLITPYVIGLVNFVVHAWELYQAMRNAWAAFKDKNTPQRKVKIGVGILSAIFTFVGLLVCASLILYGMGLPSLISVFGVTSGFFVFISAWLLAGVYALALFQKCYTFTQEKDERNKREVEWEIGFTVFEVMGSAMVGIGLIFATDVFFNTATIASFGDLSTGLMIGGTALGFLIKYFQNKDEKSGYKYTTAIKETAVEMFSKEEGNLYDINQDSNPLLQPPYFHREKPVVVEGIPYQLFEDSQDTQEQISVETSPTSSSGSISFFDDRFLGMREKEEQDPEKYFYQPLSGDEPLAIR